MGATALRNKLHQFIDNAEDKKIKAIYTIFEEDIAEINEAEEEYTAEFKAELDRRYEDYKKDGKTISRHEADKRIKKLLAKKSS
jgi:hypothetical protein